MVTRRTASGTVPALTDADVETLRRRLSAGESPRIVVRAASAAVPSGTRGTVVRLGDPAQDEYVVVRIGRDEVPFSPAELSLPGAKPVAAPPAAAGPKRSRAGATPRSRSRKPSGSPAAAAAPAAEAQSAEPSAPAPSPPSRTSAARTRQERPAKRSRAAAKPPAPLTMTLRFAGGEWSVEASRGSRRLARPAELRPGAVSALAAHLDDDALRAALTETVEACRAVVEERAAELRAELGRAEAALRDYDTKPRGSLR